VSVNNHRVWGPRSCFQVAASLAWWHGLWLLRYQCGLKGEHCAMCKAVVGKVPDMLNKLFACCDDCDSCNFRNRLIDAEMYSSDLGSRTLTVNGRLLWLLLIRLCAEGAKLVNRCKTGSSVSPPKGMTREQSQQWFPGTLYPQQRQHERHCQDLHRT